MLQNNYLLDQVRRIRTLTPVSTCVYGGGIWTLNSEWATEPNQVSRHFFLVVNQSLPAITGLPGIRALILSV
jgi:hypothetical protein